MNICRKALWFAILKRKKGRLFLDQPQLNTKFAWWKISVPLHYAPDMWARPFKCVSISLDLKLPKFNFSRNFWFAAHTKFTFGGQVGIRSTEHLFGLKQDFQLEARIRLYTRNVQGSLNHWLSYQQSMEVENQCTDGEAWQAAARCPALLAIKGTTICKELRLEPSDFWQL